MIINSIGRCGLLSCLCNSNSFISREDISVPHFRTHNHISGIINLCILDSGLLFSSIYYLVIGNCLDIMSSFLRIGCRFDNFKCLGYMFIELDGNLANKLYKFRRDRNLSNSRFHLDIFPLKIVLGEMLILNICLLT